MKATKQEMSESIQQYLESVFGLELKVNWGKLSSKELSSLLLSFTQTEDEVVAIGKNVVMGAVGDRIAKFRQKNTERLQKVVGNNLGRRIDKIVGNILGGAE